MANFSKSVNEYEIYLASPLNDHTSITFFGVGQLRIPLIFYISIDII